MPSEVLEQSRDLSGRRRAGASWLGAARLCGSTVLVLAPFIFVLALKPLAYGIWYQTEPVTAGLFAAGALACLALLLLDLAGHDLRPVFANPVLRLLAAFVAWNALASILQDFPGRSWFGTPESGEGVFAWASLLALTALALALWPWRPARLVMAAAAVASGLVIGLLDAVLPHGSPWRPELFAAYAGMIAPLVFMVVVGAARRIDWRVLLGGFLAGLAPVLFSQNKTALVLALAVGPSGYLLLRSRWVRRLRPALQRRLFTAAPLVALAATLLAIAVCMVLPHWDALYSLRSRGLLALAALQSMGDHLASLLWGFGWGSYNDLLYQHTFQLWVRGYQDGVWHPNWEGVGAGAFHCHIDALEAVLGGGLVSGALYLATFCGFIAQARRAMLPAAAVGWFLLTAALSDWYPFMLGFPFLALAIAACLAPLNPPRPIAQRHRWRRALPVAAAAALGWGTLGTVQDAVHGGHLLAALNRQQADDPGHYLALQQDHDRGGVYLWWCALNYSVFIDGQRAQGHPPTEGQAVWYQRLLGAVDGWTAQGKAGIRLAALTVALDDNLVEQHADDRLSGLRAQRIPHWGETVLRVLRLAPDRSDIAVPHLAWLAAHRQYEPILGFCEQVFLLSPRDKVCRWYSGLAMLANPTTQPVGLREMHAALRAHVDRVVPITPQTSASVREQFARLPR